MVEPLEDGQTDKQTGAGAAQPGECCEEATSTAAGSHQVKVKLASWRAVVPEACRGARACWDSLIFQPETANGSAARVASSSACNLEGLGVRMGRVESEEGCRLVGKQSALVARP